MTDDRTLVGFDWAMKSILRNKANFDVLEGFFCALLEVDVIIIAVLESEGNQEYVTDKFNRVDLQVRDSQGVEFIIEVQYNYSGNYLKRILFGSAKLITERVESGDDYQKVPKVISISLLYFAFSDPKEDEDYVYYGGTELYGLSTAKHLSVRQDILHAPKKQNRWRWL